VKLTYSSVNKLTSTICQLVFLALLCFHISLAQAQSLAESNPDLHAELVQMADDWFNFQEMQGFGNSLSLTEAYLWQEEMARIVAPILGGVVGYKTGGHDSGPGNPYFPPGGIRAFLFEGIMRPSGTAVGIEQFRRGFLEADFAFRVGSESINDAQTDLEILAGLDAFIPFAEIPDTHYKISERSINNTIVSNMSTRLSFTGAPVAMEPTQQTLDRLNKLEFAVLDENDEIVQTGSLDRWYRPVTVVRWLRDHLLSSGIDLKEGDILSLGNIGIVRQLHEGSSRGPAYSSSQFRLEYYGLNDEPATVIINIDR